MKYSNRPVRILSSREVCRVSDDLRKHRPYQIAVGWERLLVSEQELRALHVAIGSTLSGIDAGRSSQGTLPLGVPQIGGEEQD